MRCFAACLVGCFLLLPVWASEPGQPLDCSDWVFLESGLRCEVFAPPPCDGEFCVETGNRPSRTTTNTGRLIGLRVSGAPGGPCPGGGPTPLRRFEVVGFDGMNEVVLAYADERCNGSQCKDGLCFGSCWDTSEPGLYFDKERGAALFVVTSRLETGGTPSCLGSYAGQRWIVAISGFATTFEILQTYTPATAALTFRVP